MLSRIFFLGTGGDSYVVGKQIRASGGVVLKINNLQFHINPGPGSLNMMAAHGLNPRENTVILVGDNNIISCNDVNVLIDSMTYSGFDKIGILAGNETLINGTEKIKPFLTDFHKGCLEKYIVLSEGRKLGIENVEIHALKAESSDPNALGFRFITNDYILGYTGNTKYTKEIAEQYKGSDILILNVTLPAGEKSDECLNSNDAVKIIEMVNPKLAIITNFGVKMIKSDPMYEGREIQKKTNVQVIAAKDGMVVNPVSYSAKSDQKRLSSYKEEDDNQEKLRT